ncbi:hypothetical protein PO587_06625 [Streptomyces gilvifuscus]|uniref:MFS transporter n=1 Tax=Streptomyces gilvifuscus TaxID=1550617 RepID=A0ABT5FNL7_9ACTN|nr:hypothetical protein [Streptomyces gilvifuscus]MDC2954124.1 hypothetical protein [Streptomyces gilvifuscus]
MASFGLGAAFTFGAVAAAASALVALVLVPRGRSQVPPGMTMH